MSPVMFAPLLIVCLTTLQFAEAITKSCFSPDVMEGSNFYFHCYPGNRQSTVSWTLVSPTGQTTYIGSCDSHDNCSPPFANYDLRVSGRGSYIQIYPLRPDSSGTLICTEHHTDGSVEKVNCTVNVLSVLLSGCGGRGIEATENYNTSSWCYVSQSARPITWSLVTQSGQTKALGNCQSSGSCSSPESPYITATRSNSSTYSDLRINNIKRETAGTLVCSDGTNSYNCTLDVFNPMQVDNCIAVQIHRGNWSAWTSCDITRAYSALSRFEYNVYQTWVISQYQTQNKFVFDTSQPLSLTPYINTTTGVGQYRGTFVGSWTLPPLEGRYFYRMVFYPGVINSYIDGSIDGSITVEKPTSPSVYCDGVLREAGRVPCVCNTSSLGSPAGRLIWFSGDTVLAAGLYGVTSLQFPSDVTINTCDGLQITCQLDWIIKYNISMTLQVVCKVNETTKGTQETEALTVGKVNETTNGTQTTEAVQQKVPDTTTSDRLWGVGVGAGAVLAVAVVVVVVLLVFLQRRRQLSGCSSTPDGERTVTHSQQQDEAHIYTSLRMQPEVRGKMSKSKVLCPPFTASHTLNTDTCSAEPKSSCVAHPETVYENTVMSGHI